MQTRLTRSHGEMGSVLTFDTRLEVVFDLLLHMMHHGDGSNQNDRGNYLVRVKAGMEKTPGDANGSQRLHHFEITRRRCASET